LNHASATELICDRSLGIDGALCPKGSRHTMHSEVCRNLHIPTESLLNLAD